MDNPFMDGNRIYMPAFYHQYSYVKATQDHQTECYFIQDNWKGPSWNFKLPCEKYTLSGEVHLSNIL